ncbi:unnamed protein product [Adineta steineri]|uniref:Uncharacterized protein n=1 Tax=Adineta steineri TaxID=433720 RepID=A0A814VER3_9BILA|nr:unnamed protein product [Adineta steineri]CAF3606405.1 unnamed protein product [Adineta steineri]
MPLLSTWGMFRWSLFITVLIMLTWIYFYHDPAPPIVLPEISKNTFEFIRQNINKSHQATQIETLWRQIVTKFVSLPLHPGGSHSIPLLASIVLTNGSILELGCGRSSTPMLHNLTLFTRRYLLSVDSHKAWLSNMSSSMSNSPLHKFQHVTDWSTIGNDHRWSVVLVNNAPEQRRMHDIVKYAYRSQVLVIHDSEAAGYQYDKVAPFFPYKYQYQYIEAYTDVWSTTETSLIDHIRYLSELTIPWQLPRRAPKTKLPTQ